MDKMKVSGARSDVPSEEEPVEGRRQPKKVFSAHGFFAGLAVTFLLGVSTTGTDPLSPLTRFRVFMALFLAILVAGDRLGTAFAWVAAVLSVMIFRYFVTDPIHRLRVSDSALAYFEPFLICVLLMLLAFHLRDIFKRESNF
jgi:K+-sensing histidine kinase KdpD